MRRALAVVVTAALLGLMAGPAAGDPDPRWRFYSNDKTYYTSPWFAAGHRIMVPFGCTRAPYYDPDPRCRNNHGFHHGLDLAMGCGTRLFTRINAWVISHDDLGPAYGDNPIKLRNYRRGIDIVIGHTRSVYVQPGDRVHRGDLIGRASDNGAPDGCHLHFEVRDVGGSLSTARWPRPLLNLSPANSPTGNGSRHAVARDHFPADYPVSTPCATQVADQPRGVTWTFIRRAQAGQ